MRDFAIVCAVAWAFFVAPLMMDRYLAILKLQVTSKAPACINLPLPKAPSQSGSWLPLKGV